MNILYIGSSGALSLTPFKSLLLSDHKISAVGVFSPVVLNNKIIALENESLALAANQATIPVIDMAQTSDKIIEQCVEHEIDIILMSCYGKRLPDAIINLPAAGCYNMHPSLLPGFRGPEPIFWQMRYAADVGVSWHMVTHDFDAGDIVVQQPVRFDDGVSYSEVSSQLAEVGATLMRELLAAIDAGDLTTVPQDNDIASYYPYPSAHDFVIDTNYSAREIYNFMCATRAFDQPYLYQYTGLRFLLDKALDYDPNLMLETTETQADRLYIPCNEGVLTVTYTDKINI